MMRRTVFITLILGLLSASYLGVSGQGVEARLSADTTSLLIGDQIGLHLELDVPKNSKVYWPYFQNDTVAVGIEIIRQDPIDSVLKNNDMLLIRQTLIITCFDTGYHTIAPVPFKFNIPGDTTGYLIQSNPVFLEVSEPEIDMQADIKIIKPPLRAPITLKEILQVATRYGLPVLAVLFLTGIIFYIVLRRRRNQPVFALRRKPALPPHKQALKDLEGLKMKKLWQAGRIKEYYSELTEIVRWYIEERYGVRALEMTTEETINGLKSACDQDEVMRKLNRTLVLADLVKFAREHPLPADNDTSLQHMIEFVEKTKPMPAENESTEEVDQEQETLTEKV